MHYNINRDITKMVNFNAGSNITLPIGLGSPNPSRFEAEKEHASNFAQAIYGDGPYSLLRPNNTTESRAVNIDYVA